MSKLQLLLAPVIAALMCLAIASTAHAQVTSLHQVKGADPIRDFKLAVAKGDLRFLAVNGFAAGMVPGTDHHGGDAALVAAHGTRTIHGTSDSGDLELNERAWKYATTYNQLLLARLRRRPN